MKSKRNSLSDLVTLKSVYWDSAGTKDVLACGALGTVSQGLIKVNFESADPKVSFECKKQGKSD